MNVVTCFRVLSSQIGRASTESPLLLMLTTHILSKLEFMRALTWLVSDRYIYCLTRLTLMPKIEK